MKPLLYASIILTVLGFAGIFALPGHILTLPVILICVVAAVAGVSGLCVYGTIEKKVGGE